MMRFLFIFIPFLPALLLAQNRSDITGREAPEIICEVPQQPQFPGGFEALYRYLLEEVNYPKLAQNNSIQGKVFIEFVVQSDGSIGDAVVKKGVEPSLDQEALRVISNMPKWSPGYDKGKAVKVRYVLPINFKLAEPKEAREK